MPSILQKINSPIQIYKEHSRLLQMNPDTGWSNTTMDFLASGAEIKIITSVYVSISIS